MSKANYQIVYILGTGHSGSTLLDMILNTSEDCFSMGEFCFYNIYLNRKEHPKINNLAMYNCPCGVDLKECKFWQKVHGRTRGRDKVIKNYSLMDNLKIVLNVINPFEEAICFKTGHGDDNYLFDLVYDYASKEEPKLKYLVDSSKDPRRLYELIKNSDIDNNKIKVIHIKRDGRAYVNSFKKPIRVKIGQPLRNDLLVAIEWIIVNMFGWILVKKYNVENVEVTYKELSGNTVKTLAVLKNKLGIELNEKQVVKELGKSTYHGISGGQIRFKEIKNIYYDQSWRDELNEFKIFVLTILLYPFNKFLVYDR